MDTVVPQDGLRLGGHVRLAPGVYVLNEPMCVVENGTQITGDGTTLILNDSAESALRADDLSGVTIERLRIRGGKHGIRCRRCTRLTIRGCSITATEEVPPNTVFLDIWKTEEDPYGSALLLAECSDSTIEENDLQHQQNGVLCYRCTGLVVRRNQCNYNSGFGIHLFGTSRSRFEENSCDYCCRFEPREGGLHFGHMGADAAGFLIVHGSCHNHFRRNTARLGGDGFFLAGMTPEGNLVGCDDNLFEENDGSLSPNIAFEATFSRRNVFRNNFADRCNYGFWCGYSSDFVIEGNRMLFNRQAGIAVENGKGFVVKGNTFQSNGHGVLLWSQRWLGKGTNGNETSEGWQIEGNRFLRNAIGIRIAANQDHGIRPSPAEGTTPPPRDHSLTKNDIQDNRVGIELVQVRNSRVVENLLNRNVEADLVLKDCEDVEVVNNLGSRGAYL